MPSTSAVAPSRQRAGAPGVARPNPKVFVAHGTNRAIVEQIKATLTRQGYEPVVSVDEENLSVPIAEKIAAEMDRCVAAVIHVAPEMTLVDRAGNEHRLLNENVLIEIGLAMLRYGHRLILLVEKGTELPSNLRGLYEVRCAGHELDHSTTIKLMKALDHLRSQPVSR